MVPAVSAHLLYRTGPTLCWGAGSVPLDARAWGFIGVTEAGSSFHSQLCPHLVLRRTWWPQAPSGHPCSRSRWSPVLSTRYRSLCSPSLSKPPHSLCCADSCLFILLLPASALDPRTERGIRSESSAGTHRDTSVGLPCASPLPSFGLSFLMCARQKYWVT